MTTQTTTDLEQAQLWAALTSLSWFDIPSDLSEVDENWCFNRLVEYCAGELEDLAWRVDWKWMQESAQVLREIWSEDRADDARHSSGRW
jgi:hypothetical protein